VVDTFLASFDGFTILLALDMTEADVQKEDVKRLDSLLLLFLVESISHLLRHIFELRKDSLVEFLSVVILLLFHELSGYLSYLLVVIHNALE
jgi:hypothetical protein